MELFTSLIFSCAQVEEVVRHVELLEAKITDSLSLFDPRVHNQPLASLIERILRRCDRMEDELGAERDRVSDLLDEVGTIHGFSGQNGNERGLCGFLGRDVNRGLNRFLRQEGHGELKGF